MSILFLCLLPFNLRKKGKADMKATIKYKDSHITSTFNELKKEYEIYKNKNGFYVIHVLDTEIPIFNQKSQSFDLFYKIKKNDTYNVIPDRNGFYKIELIINLDSETMELLNKPVRKSKKKSE